jgi:hypothetical protein
MLQPGTKIAVKIEVMRFAVKKDVPDVDEGRTST